MAAPTPSVLDDNLPVETIIIPDSIPVTPDATEEDVIKADIPAANMMMQFVHVSWGEVKSIAGVERLIKMTIEATKHRRAVLGLPYAPGIKGESKSSVVFPID